MSHFRPAFVLLILFTALTGLAYPYAVTGVGQVVFPAQANGSLLIEDGVVIGSNLVGQNFTSEYYLWPRPSATSAADPQDASKTVDAPYNAAASTGSNLGPTSQKLEERLAASAAAWRASGLPEPIPGDAITTSGSGLDPDISPAYAKAQAARIAAAHSIPVAWVNRVIDNYVEKPIFGLFGEPKVNVLRVNHALSEMSP